MYFLSLLLPWAMFVGSASAEPSPLESLCGISSFIKVNDFKGDNNFSRYFVRARKKAVAVIIRNGKKRYCTGTMISYDLMLTAKHCVDYKRPDNLSVVFNYELDRTGRSSKEYIYEVDKFMELGGKDHLDYAIIKIKGRPGLLHGHSKLASKNYAPQEGDPILLLQHPDGEPMQLDIGLVKKTSTKFIEYDDLDTLGGSSGAGLLDKQGKIIGVHVLGGCFKVGGSNKAVSIEAIRKSSRLIQEQNL